MSVRDLIMAAQQVPKVYATWNPLDKGTFLDLSNGNLTYITASNSSVRATQGKSSGKWYFEMMCVNASQKSTMFGVGTATADTLSYPGGPDGKSWVYFFYDGAKEASGTAVAYAPAPAYNEWVGCYFDATAGTVGFISNGINRGIAFSGLVGPLYPFGGNGSSGKSGTQIANFGATAFAFTPPAGYNAGVFI